MITTTAVIIKDNHKSSDNQSNSGNHSTMITTPAVIIKDNHSSSDNHNSGDNQR